MKALFNINSSNIFLEVKPNDTVLSLLRNNGYTEVKCGCHEGECGACMILLDDSQVNSCQVLAMSVRERSIKTVKSIGTLYAPHKLQKNFIENGADQCGFCAPGMIISAYSILKEHNNNPSEKDIIEGLDGNLCRCTGYVKIVEAIKKTAEELKKENIPAEQVCLGM